MIEIFYIIFLIIFSGIFSGLTLGLMSLSTADLKRKADLGNRYAEAIYPVRKDGNFLLSTLLVGNVLVNSILSVYLGNMFVGIIAIVCSTFLITVFGEILPQAISSKHPLKIGAKSIFLVKIFQFILYPICYPIGKGLDFLLGRDLTTPMSKKEISAIVNEHALNSESKIDEDERDIVEGALDFSDKTVENVMTPKNVVYMLEEKTNITSEILEEIKSKGHTRIPVYRKFKDKIVGILLVTDLINTNRKTIGEVGNRTVFKVLSENKLDYLLNIFINNKHHLAIVQDKYGTVLGVISMEDIIEEIIKKEIVDETDNFNNMREQAIV